MAKFVAAPAKRLHDVSALDLLVVGLKYLDDYGWRQYADGSKLIGFCARGAIREAARDLDGPKRNWSYTMMHLQYRAEDLLNGCLPPSWGNIVGFNDQRGRKPEEVRTLFQCAIEKLQKRSSKKIAKGT